MGFQGQVKSQQAKERTKVALHATFSCNTFFPHCPVFFLYTKVGEHSSTSQFLSVGQGTQLSLDLR